MRFERMLYSTVLYYRPNVVCKQTGVTLCCSYGRALAIKNYVKFLFLFLFALGLGMGRVSGQTINLNESFKNATALSVTLGGEAVLTSGVNVNNCGYTNTDAAGDGWLRLTKSYNCNAGGSGSQGFAMVDIPFATPLGVGVEFEYAVYGPYNNAGYTNQPANGFATILYDANTAISAIQQYYTIGFLPGAPLGYASMSINGTMAGFPGGYLGIGFDLFGAFVDGSYHHLVTAN